MAHLGHYISGAGHVGLIAFALVGPLFSSEPLPFDTVSVTMVSPAEFAALTAQPQPQEVALPVAPAPPAVPEAETPAPAPTPDAPREQAAPPVPDAPAPEVAVPAPPPPPPQVESPQTETPTLVTPDAIAPPIAPEISERPQQRPSERVAPTPVAPPPPDVAIAEERQEAVSPDADAPSLADTLTEPQEATAPEEAASRIVTEAEEGAPSAPRATPRPLSRPETLVAAAPPQPAPSEPQPAATTPEAPTRTADAIDAALQEALAGAAAPVAAPTGPPLTAGERDGLVLAVQACWIIDPGSPAAEVVVTVGLSLTEEGRVQGDIRRISATGGDARAQDVAFEAARRAVLRCQGGGFDLPAEKYAQWQEIEMTFNPESMRIR